MLCYGQYGPTARYWYIYRWRAKRGIANENRNMLIGHVIEVASGYDVLYLCPYVYLEPLRALLLVLSRQGGCPLYLYLSTLLYIYIFNILTKEHHSILIY